MCLYAVGWPIVLLRIGNEDGLGEELLVGAGLTDGISMFVRVLCHVARRGIGWLCHHQGVFPVGWSV